VADRFFAWFWHIELPGQRRHEPVAPPALRQGESDRPALKFTK